MKKKPVIGALVVLTLIALFFILRYLYPFDGTYHVRTLTLPNDRTMEIRADIFWEVSQAVEYRLPDGKRSDLVGFTTETPRKLSFHVLSASGGNLVAVVERSNPDVVLMLHDFASGKTWPNQTGSETWHAVRARGHSLLARLQNEHTGSRLKAPGSDLENRI